MPGGGPNCLPYSQKRRVPEVDSEGRSNSWARLITVRKAPVSLIRAIPAHRNLPPGIAGCVALSTGLKVISGLSSLTAPGTGAWSVRCEERVLLGDKVNLGIYGLERHRVSPFWVVIFA